MSDTFAAEAERLHETAARLPGLLDDAVQGVCVYAAAVSELVQNLDARRSALNQQAHSLGVPAVPDVVAGCVAADDTVRARLIAAARMGAGALAVGLGNAARGPACLPGAADPFDTETMGNAARAATALLTWTHHQVEGVTAGDLLADADPVKAAMLLAGIAVKLAGESMPEGEAVADWIASMGAAWALDGD